MLLIAIKLSIITIISIILIQPIHRVIITKGITRTIAVLVDTSSSMEIVDSRISTTNKLNIANLLGIEEIEKRPQIDKTIYQLESIRDKYRSLFNTLNFLNSDSKPAYMHETEKKELERIKQNQYQLSESIRDIIKYLSTLSDREDILSRRSLKDIEKFKEIINNKILKKNSENLKLTSVSLYKNINKTEENISSIIDNISEIIEELRLAKKEYDADFYTHLNFDTRESINDIMNKIDRLSIAKKCLLNGKKENFIEKLSTTHNVELFQFNSQINKINNINALKIDKNNQQHTDISKALEEVKKRIPSENLAGILLISDGCHNSNTDMEFILKALRRQQVPVCTIEIGSTLEPKDNSIITAKYPNTVFLGDKVEVNTEIKSIGFKGKTLSLQLIKTDKVIQEKLITINSDNARVSIKIPIKPETKGLYNYKLKLIAKDSNEFFLENNIRDISFAVTDKRINILLVDNYPRWEFRYLRNLFHARDKSIKLQHILLSPEKIEGAPKSEPIYASIDRKFGDDHADKFPKNQSEWSKFEVIIIGDLPPQKLNDKILNNIKHCVEKNGSLLVCIAGQNHMPLDYTSPILKELLPIIYDKNSQIMEEPFFISLSSIGLHHPVMQQDKSFSKNINIWDAMPNINYFIKIDKIKTNSETLAYASLNDKGTGTSQKNTTKYPVIVAGKLGQGRTLMLNFDKTWRFRYGVGDKYHHKFWKQVINWGIGDKLRAGNNYIKLATNSITYTDNDRIKLTARVQNKDFKSINDAKITATIYNKNKVVRKKTMLHKPLSEGIYEVNFSRINKAGEYTVKLSSQQLKEKKLYEDSNEISTDFLIVGNNTSQEFSELASNSNIMHEIAKETNGIKVNILNIDRVIPLYGDGNKKITIKKEIPLWDNYKILIIILLLISSEMALRKKWGLV
jgi:hypothetical protein